MRDATKRAAIYARSATSQEFTPGYATDAQIQACSAYATEHGYEVVEGQIYQETASGNDSNRAGLIAVLAAAQEGKFDIVVIHDFNRLARTSQLLKDLIERFEAAGVKVVSATEDAAVSLMVAVLLEGVAQIERERMAARSRAGRRASRVRAKHPPFGYTNAEGAPASIIHPQEADAVTHLFSNDQ